MALVGKLAVGRARSCGYGGGSDRGGVEMASGFPLEDGNLAAAVVVVNGGCGCGLGGRAGGLVG